MATSANRVMFTQCLHLLSERFDILFKAVGGWTIKDWNILVKDFIGRPTVAEGFLWIYACLSVHARVRQSETKVA